MMEQICEGSSVYASAIANKLIEVMDRLYAAIPPTTTTTTATTTTTTTTY